MIDLSSNLQNGINALASKAGLPSPFNAPDISSLVTWNINGTDWYKVFGYEFNIVNLENSESPDLDPDGLTSGGKSASYTYVLPIPPQQMAISPKVASQATATIGGVVEESSETQFWNIMMAGTTGIAVSRNDGSSEFNRTKASAMFRETLTTTGLLSGISGSVNSAVNKIGNIIDGGVDAFKAFSNGDAAGGIGSVVGAVNSAILPPAPFSSSAVSPDTNGYTEIEELSKFFYLYNKLKSKHSGDWALYFKNYRSNQMWRCIVNGFSIQRMAQQPYLYRYQIQLQAWDVKGIKNTSQATMDRFGPGGDLAAVNTVSMQSYGKLHNMALKTTSKSKSGGGMFLSPGGNIL